MKTLTEEEQKFWDYIKGPEETLEDLFGSFGGPSRGHTLPPRCGKGVKLGVTFKALLYKIKKTPLIWSAKLHAIKSLLDIYNLKTRITKMNGMGGWTYMQTT